MTRRTLTSRRGVALLIVLATLVVVTTVCASLAQLASLSMLDRRIAADGAQADELRLAGEGVIQRWLNLEADRTVLSPDVAEPRTSVLADRWTSGERAYELRITAWDQCGMVPLSETVRGSPLRATLPESLLDLVDAPTARSADHPPGLDDWFVLDPRVFPRGETSSPLLFGEHDAAPSSESFAMRGEDPSSATSCFGAQVATHNPPRLARGNRAATININTAPRPLLLAAMRMGGQGGVEAIIQARAKGRMGRPPSGSAAAGDRLTLSGVSHAWAFRMDIRVGIVERSWWIVYVRGPASWEVAQRLVIPA